MHLTGRSRRLAALALLGALAGSAEAWAAPTAVVVDQEGQEAALSGEDVLLTRVSGQVLRVLALPISGRGPLTERFGFTAAPGETPSARLEASDSSAALVVQTTAGPDDYVRARQAFAGPASGPFGALGPTGGVASGGYIAESTQVDGDRVFTTERNVADQSMRITAHEPGAAPAAVALPPDVLTPDTAPAPVFAGDLVAYALRLPGQPRYVLPRRVVVQDWRTGVRRTTAVVAAGIAELDLLPAGSVAVGEQGRPVSPRGLLPSGILTIAPGASTARRVSSRGAQPQFAGSRIVFVRQERPEGHQRLMVAAPGRPPRPFGVRSSRIEAFATNARRVLWRANGCVLTAPLSAAAASAPAPGPCVRSEVFLDDGRRPRIGRDRRLSVPLRCLAAAAAGCRGTVRLFGEDAPGGAAGSARFQIPVGARRDVSVRLSPAGYRFVRRDWLDGGAVIDVRATVVDPAGRRDTLSDGMLVDVAR